MRQKHFQMGEIFVTHRPLAPLSTIYLKNASVEYELVDIFNNLLGVVGRGSGVGIRDLVVNLLQGDLDGDSGQVGLAETFVVCYPVGVQNDGVRLVEMGEKIQRTGSAIPVVRLVEDSEERVFNSAYKLLVQGAVDV